MNALLEWYQALAQRERKLVFWGGLSAGFLILVFGILWPLHTAVAGARQRVENKSADLVWMRSHALEVLASASGMAGAGDSLVVIIDRTAHELGLADMIKGTTPSGANGTRVELQNAPFDLMAGWLARLHEQYGVNVAAATFDHSGAPGLVNASLELTRGGS
jgi:type II secretory pathway component PulM